MRYILEVMYYRRKLLLAILQTWGGRLHNTDFQKILFLFSQKQEKPNFEFMPYKFGCFSWQSYADKRTMVTTGHLSHEEDWQLTDNSDYVTSLVQEDQQRLLDLKRELGNLHGNDLIHLVYTRYPYFAIKSQIAHEILTSYELEMVEQARPSQTESVLFTIGYEGRSVDGFVDLLLHQNIVLLCDVRKNAFSMKNGFSKTQLAGALRGVGIEYKHIPELGIESGKRKNLVSQKDYDELFEEYEKETLPSRTRWVEDVIREVENRRRVALMCFEKEPCMCHRGSLAHTIEDHPAFEHSIAHL